MRAMIEVKISSDIPLPIPRSVINSPNHMMTAVPAVITVIITKITHTESFGMMASLHPLNKAPGVRASDKMAVDCKTAKPIVKNRVY
ncbi:unannotated protein [freshwater metagenome]|uniref:Unannotated protein n=1 Tax=freshwater metagenome TaxID=449393 RepID=A0A6J6LIU4_9ZZZZ